MNSKLRIVGERTMKKFRRSIAFILTLLMAFQPVMTAMAETGEGPIDAEFIEYGSVGSVNTESVAEEPIEENFAKTDVEEELEVILPILDVVEVETPSVTVGGSSNVGKDRKETIVMAKGLEEPNYLTFTATEDDSSVTFRWSEGRDVQISTDNGETWSAYVKGTTVSLNANEYISFKGYDVKTSMYPSHFSMAGSIEASGSVTSLLDGVGSNPDVILPSYCFSFMFAGCSALKKAPALPAETLSYACYWDMFSNCKGLTEVPELPAMELAGYCYWEMFYGCTGLTEVPALQAEEMDEYCYCEMFAGCSNLQKVPEFSTKTLANGCYDQMFRDCTSLKLCKDPGNGYFEPWTISGEEEKENWNLRMFSGCTGVDLDGEGLQEPELNTIYYQLGSHVHNGIAFEAWSATDRLPVAVGSYYLIEDIDMGRWTTPSGTTDLCLNGHKVNGAITVPADGSLNIFDCSEDHTGKIGFTLDSSSGRYSLIDCQGCVNLYGGNMVLVGNESGTNQVVYASGIFSIYGGLVKCINNGNAIVCGEPPMYIYGGEIDGRILVGGNGGIHLKGSPVFTNCELALSGFKITLDGALDDRKTSERIVVIPKANDYEFTVGWNDKMSGKQPQDYFVSPYAERTIKLNDNGEAVVVAGYEITLSNEGAETSGTTTIYAANGTALPGIEVPKKTGYTFAGYYTDKLGQGIKYYNADGTSAKDGEFTSDVTLYAKWNPIFYTVTILSENTGKGTVSPEAVSVPYGSTISSNGSAIIVNGTTINASAQSGYVFSSWSGIPSGNIVTGDVTITANFSSAYSGGGGGGGSSSSGGGGGGGSSSGGGGGGGAAGPKASATTATFSSFWYDVGGGVWRIQNNGVDVKSAWLCDDAIAANGKEVWYLMNTDGTMLVAGLVQDNTGNFYSLETTHNGYYGMLRYKNGTYDCNGQKIYLEFSQKHDGTFGAVTNADGLAKLKTIYGVTKFGVDNNSCQYTATFK